MTAQINNKFLQWMTCHKGSVEEDSARDEGILEISASKSCCVYFLTFITNSTTIGSVVILFGLIIGAVGGVGLCASLISFNPISCLVLAISNALGIAPIIITSVVTGSGGVLAAGGSGTIIIKYSLALCSPKTVEVEEGKGSSLSDGIRFIGRFCESPDTVGSIFPSSDRLATAIVRKVREFERSQDDTPCRFLEIGAGTGAFTQKIIDNLQEGDHLDIVEFDSTFCALLRDKFGGLSNVTIHEMSILDYTPEESYDVVVSGLPLNAFSPVFVEAVIEKYKKLTKSAGYLSYFEYMALPKIKQTFLFGQTAADFQRVLAAKQALVEGYATETDDVWGNLTPARVRHINIIHNQAE